VYHANYLALAERARTESMVDAGLPHARLIGEHDCQFMVRRAKLEYFRPARLDDILTITTRALSETAATLTLDQAFSVAGADAEMPIASLVVELVCVRCATGRPTRIPPPWRGFAHP
jgi:acyl-CoA thioester hydrolase